jgi:hypothetical protein
MAVAAAREEQQREEDEGEVLHWELVVVL